MRLDPSEPEGQRTLSTSESTSESTEATPSESKDARQPLPLARAGLGGLLVVVAVALGFAIGGGPGSADAPPTTPSEARSTVTPPTVDAAPPSEAVEAYELASHGITPGQQPMAANDLADVGEVVAKYAPIPIETLPIHQDEPGSGADAKSLTVVTRGEIAPGQTLGTSLRGQGVDPAAVHLIAKEMRKVFDFRKSLPGDEYRLGQDADGRVLDFRYAQTDDESFYLAWEGTRYVVRKETTELRPQIAKIAGLVDSSFYGAIMSLGEQSSLASQFSRILAWDIDFSRNVHPGDEFQILYERLYRRTADGEDVYVRPGRILAGRYDGRSGRHIFVYFEDEAGRGAYFRPDGSSVERAFLVAPLEYSRITSRFTKARQHPILNITRPHLGIDYAAPSGTPIWSVADGVVEFRGRAGASGNLVRIRHASGYTSHYAHLSRFEQGLKVGDQVRQKQVIGYVGSTGLSTGPHVCFRVKKHGRYVDPMTIQGPAGAPVNGALLATFHSVRDRLLADLGPGPLSVADEAL